MTVKFLIPLALLFALLIQGCGEDLPVKKSIKNNYVLLNQDSSNVNFPKNYKDKIVVMGFIYTNCPDICPLTVNNMQTIQEKIEKSKINDVDFIALSFDPGRDTPSVLKKYAEVRNIDFNNFNFLTGNKQVIKPLLKEMGVYAAAEDTTFNEDGKPVYYMTHNDRISLIDQKGRLRKNYRGSSVNIENIVNDIKSLE